MEYIVLSLGFDYLQTLTAKQAVKTDNGVLYFMPSQTRSSNKNSGKKTFTFGAYYTDILKKGSFDCDDDTTECTLLSMDDSSVSSTSSTTLSSSNVSFAEPLVTKVYERPLTLPSEKEQLFYTEAEYRKFRRDFHRMRRRGFKSVHFADSLVSSVWTLPENDNKEELFYTESELRNFLEDFILSLNKDQREDELRN